jgi:hypothetical protein
MKHWGLAAVGAAFALASALPAAARDLPPGGLTATELAAWLKGKGMPAQVKADPTTPGDQIVSSAQDGVNFDLYLYDCSGNGDARRCTSMQYAAGWGAKPVFTADKANSWNSGNRYVRAYITSDGALFGEYDLDVSPGGTFEMLDDTLENWQRGLARFIKYFDL